VAKKCASEVIQVNIVIGSDHFALDLKAIIKAHIEAQGHRCDDFGTHTRDPVDYPDIALKVAEDIADGEHERGILICGTGIGMAIVANKVPGVRAAQVDNVYQAERARKSNNAQIMTLGSQVVGPELAKLLVDAWLRSEFSGGRSAPKVAKIEAIDERFRRRE
jgi:ribose 5-phosphate isomerase B